MAIKSFKGKAQRGSENAAERRVSDPLQPSAPVKRTVAPSTSVDASSELEGRLSCKETLRIDGRIKGEVDCTKMVLVGAGACVHASITADEIRISGVVEGNITARRMITLERTAVVTGDLVTQGIVIEQGAKLKGRIVIGAENESVEDTAPAKEAKPQGLRAPPASRPNEAASQQSALRTA